MQFGIPEVFESDAEGIVKEIYEDIKYVLKVPIVNFIFRALANYPEFLRYAWDEVRPNMLTINMETAANELRYPAINTQVPPYTLAQDYDPQMIETIRKILSTFQYVNPKLLLIANAWAEALADRPISPQKGNLGFIEPGVFRHAIPIQLVHIPSSPLYLKQLFYDIAKVHHAYDVASDYRALAVYPRFLETTWHSLKDYLASDEYTLLKSNLLTKSISLTQQTMSFGVCMNQYNLTSFYSSSQLAGIMGLVSYFQNFLPGLIVENEYMRRMID